jgi:UDP-galactopyranose mutase
MNIELDDEVIASLKKKAEKIVLDDLVGSMKREINLPQVIAEIRNKAVSLAAKELSDSVTKTYTSKVFDKAMQSVQDRVNSKVHEILSRGITVKFGDL